MECAKTEDQKNFDDFWLEAENQAQDHNPYRYGRCCDVWITKGCRTKPHHDEISWGQLTQLFGRKKTEQKMGLLNMIQKRNLKLPPVFNTLCSQIALSKKAHLTEKKPKYVKKRTLNDVLPPQPHTDPTKLTFNESAINPELIETRKSFLLDQFAVKTDFSESNQELCESKKPAWITKFDLKAIIDELKDELDTWKKSAVASLSDSVALVLEKRGNSIAEQVALHVKANSAALKTNSDIVQSQNIKTISKLQSDTRNI